MHTVCKQKAKKEAEARLIAEALLTLTGAAPVSTFPAQKTFIPMSEDELKLAASTK